MSKKLKYTYVFVFFILISGIGILTVFNIGSAPIDVFKHYEKRLPASKPAFEFKLKSIKNFCPSYEMFIKDNFSLRSELIMAFSQIHKQVGVSIKPEKGFFGKNGYIFVGNNLNSVIDQTTGRSIFTNAELNEWNRSFVQRKEYLEAQGAKMYVCVAPNKHSVYSEYLPNYIKPDENNRLQQILSSNPDFNIFCSLDTLLKAKPFWGDLLYYKSGTHWSSIGAYIGYLEIINQISGDFPDVKAIKLDAENFNIINHSKGSDIPPLMYLESLDDFETQIIKCHDWTENLIKTNYEGDTLPINSLDQMLVNEQSIVYNPLKKKSLLIIKDSFSTALSTFLNQTFGKVIYCHYNQQEGIELTQLVEKHKPDVVLFQFAERMLINKQYVHPNIIFKSINIDFNPIFKMDADYLYNNLIPQNHIIDLSLESDGVHFNSTGNDPFLMLPALDLSKDKLVVINIEFTIPCNSITQIFYQTKDEKQYSEEKSIRIKANQGQNKIHYILPEKSINGKVLRFDPGTFSGDYVIHSIEIFEGKTIF